MIPEVVGGAIVGTFAAILPPEDSTPESAVIMQKRRLPERVLAVKCPVEKVADVPLTVCVPPATLDCLIAKGI